MESLPDVVGGKALCHHFGDASFAVGEIYAFVGQVYPAWSRATGLGWAAGVGRIGAIVGPIVIGALLAGDRGYPWGFYVFAGVAALAAGMVLIVGHPRDVVDEEISEHGTIAH
jgi:MFS family permease